MQEMKHRWYQNVSLRTYIIASAGLVALSALVLLLLGRVPICDCGFVKLWHSDIDSSGNSQHLIDWYTFSHLIYGFIFYGLTYLVGGRRWPIGLRLLVAVGLEVSWEIIENTDYIINTFREVNIWRGYFGDSIVNSVGDIVAMIAGFFMAYRLPIWSLVIIAVILEAVSLYFVRDSLIIGTIMFFHPVEAIEQWQAAGPAFGDP